MKEHKRKHLVSPYNYALSWGALIGCIALLSILSWLWYGQAQRFPENHPGAPFLFWEKDNKYFAGAILLSASLPFLIISVAFEMYGKVYILDDCLELRALFHRRRRIYYSDIKYLGIDYRILNFTRQFWIYFREDDFPPEGKNKHHPFRNYVFTKRIDHIDMRNIRVQFNQRVFDDLVYYLPPKLSKKLSSCYSIIRLYHEDGDEYERYKPKKKKGKKK